jgi:ubiquinone/menaquinone biosynthesis C-methylase UbiE
MIIAVVLSILALGLLLAFGLVKLHVPRDLTREGPDDLATVRAYDRVSHWCLFTVIRWLVIRRLRTLPSHGVLVDAGCGPGYLTVEIARRFPGSSVVGVDISSPMLALAAGRGLRLGPCGRPQFVVAAVEGLPFTDSSVDIVVSTLSLHHWVKPELALAEFFRVLKPGGSILIFDLRRDLPRGLFQVFRLGQFVLAPPPIKRINGAVGSVWASLTIPEAQTLLGQFPFLARKVSGGLAWAWLWARK